MWGHLYVFFNQNFLVQKFDIGKPTCYGEYNERVTMNYPELPEGYTWAVDFDADGDLVLMVKRPDYNSGDYPVQMTFASLFTTPNNLQLDIDTLAKKINEGVKYIGENK